MLDVCVHDCISGLLGRNWVSCCHAMAVAMGGPVTHGSCPCCIYGVSVPVLSVCAHHCHTATLGLVGLRLPCCCLY
jgi:hypothetical protein